jgi:hypothetical protein
VGSPPYDLIGAFVDLQHLFLGIYENALEIATVPGQQYFNARFDT